MAESVFHVPEALSWRALDGEWLVFQARTGMMLQIDAASAIVLSLLEEGPATAASVASRLAQETELPCDQTMQSAASVILSRLRELGLVSDNLGVAW